MGLHHSYHWNKSLIDDFQVFHWFLASAIIKLDAIFYCGEKIRYPLWRIEKFVIKANGKSILECSIFVAELHGAFFVGLLVWNWLCALSHNSVPFVPLLLPFLEDCLIYFLLCRTLFSNYKEFFILYVQKFRRKFNLLKVIFHIYWYFLKLNIYGIIFHVHSVLHLTLTDWRIIHLTF